MDTISKSNSAGKPPERRESRKKAKRPSSPHTQAPTDPLLDTLPPEVFDRLMRQFPEATAVEDARHQSIDRPALLSLHAVRVRRHDARRWFAEWLPQLLPAARERIERYLDRWKRRANRLTGKRRARFLGRGNERIAATISATIQDCHRAARIAAVVAAADDRRRLLDAVTRAYRAESQAREARDYASGDERRIAAAMRKAAESGSFRHCPRPRSAWFRPNDPAAHTPQQRDIRCKSWCCHACQPRLVAAHLENVRARLKAAEAGPGIWMLPGTTANLEARERNVKRHGGNYFRVWDGDDPVLIHNAAGVGWRLTYDDATAYILNRLVDWRGRGKLKAITASKAWQPPDVGEKKLRKRLTRRLRRAQAAGDADMAADLAGQIEASYRRCGDDDRDTHHCAGLLKPELAHDPGLVPPIAEAAGFSATLIECVPASDWRRKWRFALVDAAGRTEAECWEHLRSALELGEPCTVGDWEFMGRFRTARQEERERRRAEDDDFGGAALFASVGGGRDTG